MWWWLLWGGSGEITARLREGLYSSESTQLTPEFTLYSEYVKNVSGPTTFNTVIYPTMPGNSAEVYTEELKLDVDKSAANAFSATIIEGNKNLRKSISYYTLFDETQKEERAFGEYITDGVLAFTEKVGEDYTKLILRGGQLLTAADGTVLLSSKSSVSDLAVEYNGNKLLLSTSKTSGENAVNIRDLTVYAPRDITSVTLNGEPIGFVKGKDKIYLDPNIIPDEPAEPDEPNEDESKKPEMGGSTHGAGGGGIVGGGDVPGNGNIAQGNNGSSDSDIWQEENGNKGENTNNLFSDISGHWAENYINAIAEKNIITGYPDGTFRPDETVTRAELVTMAARMLNLDTGDYIPGFSDITSEDWYAGAVTAALKYGMVSKDDKFRPDDSVTREEMCKILSYTMGYTNEIQTSYENLESKYSDYSTISLWALPYVAYMYDNDIVTGVEETKFAPKEFATRGQVATIIFRILKKNK